MLKYLLFTPLFAFIVMNAEAKIFNNDYVSFEMPDTWKCKPFQTDWVCHSSLSQKQKEAMIIVTAKMAGSLDKFDHYKSFLSQPRSGQTKSQKSFRSKVFHSKKVYINNHLWVDGFHKSSEIPSYFTRYIVTICCEKSSSKLAILVTYSAHQDHYTKYAKDFLKSINSLRVLDVEKAVSNMKTLGSGENLGSISSYMEGIIDEEIDDEGSEGKSSNNLLSPENIGIGLFVLLTLLGYFVIKKKSRKKRRKKRSKK